MRISVWRRWKRLAHRAAEVQAHVLFLALYFVGIVPIRALGLGRSDGEAIAGAAGSPHWISRAPITCDLSWARRQF
jgi:hypothetical protein